MLTLSQLGDRTNLPVRRLQYVCDHDVVPPAAGKGQGFGVARTFTDYEAFGIAVAGYLLQAGYARKHVVDILRLACTPLARKSAPGSTPLHQTWRSVAAALEIGDGHFVRIQADGRPGATPLDTGWLPLHPKGLRLRLLTPVVGTRVDLAQVRRTILGPNSSPLG